MAGNKRSGRNPRPQVYLGDGDVHSVVVPGAIPVPDLSGDAMSLWVGVVVPLSERGVVTAGDAAAAQAMCEVWQLYRKALISAMKDPLDKNARCAVKAYLSDFDRLASRFGLTPSDRQRLKASTDKAPPKLSKFIS